MTGIKSRIRGSRRRALLAVSLAAVLALPACDDFLTTEPRAQLTTANFFTDSDHALQATTATYAMLRNWTVHVLFWLGMTDIASDDATKGGLATSAGYLDPFENLQWDAGNPVLMRTWAGYYEGIHRANVAIQNIPGISMDEELRSRLVAENKFLRAYYYFFLVRAFGGVPLVTEVLEADDFLQSRASAEEVYAQIEQDLLEAIADLPERTEYASADVGRATKGAARGLLAKVHLFQGEYQQTLRYAEEVIESGEYGLYPSYSGIFTRDGENSSEALFEVQAAAFDPGGPGPSHGGSQYTQVQMVRGTPNLGWGLNTPSPNLEKSYEPGDPRHQATILYPWEQLPDRSDQIVWLNPQMPNNRYNQKAFRPSDEPGSATNSGVNIRRLRYADVLLMAAEASYQMGDQAKARTYLNGVRERARDGRDVTLGFQAEPLAAAIAEGVLGLTTDSRVFVRYIDEDAPAYQAGVRTFEASRDNALSPVPVRVQNMDIIVSLDGATITDLESYLNAVDNYSAGATVAMEILRVSHPEGSEPVTSTFQVDVPILDLLPDITVGGQDLLTAIWTERRHELGLEQHRWFDLIRQDRAEQVMEALTCEDRMLSEGCPQLIFEPHQHVYPLPATEVNVAGLEQNPGYGS